MVNFGPSGACVTCKRRKKKCDETRPSCLSCQTAKRTCGGYEEDAHRKFRQYQRQYQGSLPFKSMARKCSLPAQTSGPVPEMQPNDGGLPQEISKEKLDEVALQAFFYDFCVISTNQSLSRGYLGSLELMLHHRGWQSDLAKACKVVEFASHSTLLRRPSLMRKAELMYHDLLGSLAKAIDSAAFADNAESLTIAMLLGLYEMIVATETRPDNHSAHARGVAAILRIESAPLDLFWAVRSIRSGEPISSNSLVRTTDVLHTPYSNDASRSLDDLLVTFGPIWRKVDSLQQNPLMGSDDLRRLMNEAIALDQAFANWQETRSKDFGPWTVSSMSQPQAGSKLEVGYWPGRVDMYFDLYVAGVWNTARMARVLLLDLILKHALNDNHNYGHEHQDNLRGVALHLVEDIISSMPFSLAEDLDVFLQDRAKENTAAKMQPGIPVGGLLLMHPVYMVSRLSIVPEKMREYMRDCLEWIATNMGIGQASVLAKVPDIHEDYVANGFMIVWAGMLL